MREDCFGYKKGKCNILTELVCKNGGKCSFYKTKEQFRKDAQRAEEKNKYKGAVQC